MTHFLKRLFFIFALHKSIPFAFRFFTSTQIPWGKRLLFAVLCLGYVALPFDVINDFLLGVGLIDDVAVMALLLDGMKKQASTYWHDESVPRKLTKQPKDYEKK